MHVSQFFSNLVTYNAQKEVGILINSKKTSSLLELTRNSHVAIMHQSVLVIVSSITRTQIKHSLAYTSTKLASLKMHNISITHQNHTYL